MGKKLFSIFCLLAILVIAAPAPVQSGAAAKSVQDIGIFKADKFDAHYRVPSEAGIELILDEEGVVPPEGAGMKSLTQEFIAEFSARNPDVPNPMKLKQLLANEQGKAGSRMGVKSGEAAEEPKIMSLVIPVEFTGVDETVTYEYDDGVACVTETGAFSGPLHNEIAPPGPRDNNTIWYDDTTPDLYDEIYFGEGPDAGVIVNHPNLGEVDLRGRTMVNYYLEQSKGKFRPYGAVYPAWVPAVHAEAYYGQDNCAGSHNINAHVLVAEVLDWLMANDPDFGWQEYDGDADGLVDNFTIIHAGMGQEAGGGAQGDLAIWSHASLVGWPEGIKVCSAGSAGCPDRDIYVREYSMDPENIDLGVISEEFGHAAFGLPDIYATDYQNPVSNWAIMESGSWNGILGGMEPAPFPLWFRYILGWSDPVELDYTVDFKRVVVGQHSKTPRWTADGIKINLPDKQVQVDNPLGTGQALWSDVGDVLQNTAAFSLDLTPAAAPVLSFNSYWSIEEDWDYGYVEVSTDDGATWTILDDTGEIFRDTDPNGNNEGWGLTGEGSGILSFDLSPYVGSAVMVRVRYSTDTAAQWAGWWIDDVTVADGATVLFAEDFEAGSDSWVVDGWQLVPFTQIFERYYLVEWRNYSGFDKGLIYPYQTVYSDDDEWEVDRTPYTAPGMLVWFRDASYAFDYTLSDSWYDPPSWGVQHALTIIDSHPFPYTWDTFQYSTGAGVRLSGRVTPGDATFTLGDTVPFTARLGYDPFTGIYTDEPLETKTFGPEPGVQQFHDAVGYYPGFYFNGDGSLYWWDIDGGGVVPAKDNYTTRITDLDQQPIYGLYGIDVGGTVLGSGNPGDSGVQYGLHIAPVKQDEDGKWAVIDVWNTTDPLVQAEVKTYPFKAYVWGPISYGVRVHNPTTVPQPFSMWSAVPEGTTFVAGMNFDPDTNTVSTEGILKPGQTKYVLLLRVRVGLDMAGEAITNIVYVNDEATGEVAVTTNTDVFGRHYRAPRLNRGR